MDIDRDWGTLVDGVSFIPFPSHSCACVKSSTFYIDSGFQGL